MALCRLIELQREHRAAQDDLLHTRKVVGDMEDELVRLWWDGGFLANKNPDILALRRRLGLPVAGGLTAEDLKKDVERQRRWLVAQVTTSHVSELGVRSFILDGLRQVQPRYRLPPQVPEGMRALEDAEETHHCLSFTSRRTLERLAMNLGEDVLGLELAMQEQWWDMVRSLGVTEAEEMEAMEVDSRTGGVRRGSGLEDWGGCRGGE
ncbi:hypothetical protein C0992_008964 [Termitomyces sp. T32_za158]|nr:hypothetical protein C0992_008964 [Termitomyces sp. T32_za158]